MCTCVYVLLCVNVRLHVHVYMFLRMRCVRVPSFMFMRMRMMVRVVHVRVPVSVCACRMGMCLNGCLIYFAYIFYTGAAIPYLAKFLADRLRFSSGMAKRSDAGLDETAAHKKKVRGIGGNERQACCKERYDASGHKIIQSDGPALCVTANLTHDVQAISIHHHNTQTVHTLTFFIYLLETSLDFIYQRDPKVGASQEAHLPSRKRVASADIAKPPKKKAAASHKCSAPIDKVYQATIIFVFNTICFLHMHMHMSYSYLNKFCFKLLAAPSNMSAAQEPTTPAPIETSPVPSVPSPADNRGGTGGATHVHRPAFNPRLGKRLWRPHNTLSII